MTTHITKRIVRTGGLVLIVAILAGYAYFESRAFLGGPQITVVTPENGATVEDDLIMITGTAQHISHITMNGRQIFVDTAGKFAEQYILSYGYNVITVAVEDRYGRTHEEHLELIYK